MSLVDWYIENFSNPLFMLAQGIILGLMRAKTMWIMYKRLKKETDDVEK